MAKEFMSFDELVALLESRGVEIDEDSRKILMRESYYAIINGYKAPFLDTEKMKSTATDCFLSGTKFNSIYGLFSFDRELRAITFKYLIKCEAMVKTAVVHSFCEAHRDPRAYLNIGSYTNHRDMLVPKGYRGDKAELYRKNSRVLVRELCNKVESSKPYISHYANAYGFVPLWVLSNDLSFGNIMHFYQLQKRGEQNAACKIISESAGSDRCSFERLTPQKLLHSLSVLVSFRNICAHDERLYCARVGKQHEYDFGAMTSELACILPKSEIEAFIRDVGGVICTYEDCFAPLEPHDLLISMGVHEEMMRVQ